MNILSKRMEAAAAMVTSGNILADVGTDHGYIPIALVLEKRIRRAIAMDLRRGPLERAKAHIRRFGLEAYIETRLSDGVEALAPDEADTILIAGMGGGLVIQILKKGESVCRTAKELVLQPQSEVERVRRFLRENRYRITAEDMVLEDGKYYPMMKAVPEKTVSQEAAAGTDPKRQQLCDRYGPLLLLQRHPVLEDYLLRQEKQLRKLCGSLEQQEKSAAVQKRLAEVKEELEQNRLAQWEGMKHAGV